MEQQVSLHLKVPRTKQAYLFGCSVCYAPKIIRDLGNLVIIYKWVA